MTRSNGHQCVTIPKIWTKPNPNLFFRYQIFLIPNLILFLIPNNFWYRIQYFFSIPNFSNTESDTFFDTKFFRYRIRYFFRYQIFSIPNPIPSQKLEKFRNREVSKPKRHTLNPEWTVVLGWVKWCWVPCKLLMRDEKAEFIALTLSLVGVTWWEWAYLFWDKNTAFAANWREG